MAKRDSWIAVALLVATLMAHAVFPRYEWRNLRGLPVVRIDRWTGRAEIGSFHDGTWVKPSPAPPPTVAASQVVALPFVSTDPNASQAITPIPIGSEVQFDAVARKYGGVPVLSTRGKLGRSSPKIVPLDLAKGTAEWARV